jgi:hypothetical protein
MQFVELSVPKRYLNNSDTGAYAFTVPIYDQDYTVKISFPNSADGQNSFTGVAFPDYQTAYNLVVSQVVTYKWSGLLELEKDIFVDFIHSFRNSYQPFLFTHYDESSTVKSFEGIIQQDAVQISKDNFDLYSASLTIII